MSLFMMKELVSFMWDLEKSTIASWELNCIFQLKSKRYIGYARYKYFAHDVLMTPKLLRSLILL